MTVRNSTAAVLPCGGKPGLGEARAGACAGYCKPEIRKKRQGQPCCGPRSRSGRRNLLVEATARGLRVHQMIGILPDKARQVFGTPEGYEAWTGIAIGYEGDPATPPDNLKQRDLTPGSANPSRSSGSPANGGIGPLPAETLGLQDMEDSFQVICPYRGENIELFLESDVEGSLVQDCEVCCNP